MRLATRMLLWRYRIIGSLAWVRFRNWRRIQRAVLCHAVVHGALHAWEEGRCGRLWPSRLRVYRCMTAAHGASGYARLVGSESICCDYCDPFHGLKHLRIVTFPDVTSARAALSRWRP